MLIAEFRARLINDKTTRHLTCITWILSINTRFPEHTYMKEWYMHSRHFNLTLVTVAFGERTAVHLLPFYFCVWASVQT